MKVIEDNFNITLDNPTIVVLGSFDGVHLGHRALVEGALRMARDLEKRHNIEKVDVMVCTFKNHPLSIINKERCPKLIMDNSEKINVFKKLGVDILNFMNFNEEFMKISPISFILNLINKYRAKGIVVGFNYRFGYKNTGDVSLLEEKSKQLGYELKVINPVKSSEEVISSTVIRACLEEGDVEKANDYLGRPFMVYGKVVPGRRIGRTIDIPTANIDYDKSFVIPKCGVYGTVVEVDGSLYKGITNIGNNPTVSGKETTLETHILDFDKQIYGYTIKVFFIEKLRVEKKFRSIDELKKQLFSDKLYVSKSDYSRCIKDIKKEKNTKSCI